MICSILHPKIETAISYYSNSQLIAYIDYRFLQKTKDLMRRQLTWPHFLEYCGQEVLLWHYYITEKVSKFRNKVSKIISAETNPVIVYTSWSWGYSQDIQIFVLTFWSCSKNDLFRKIKLVSKFMTSQPD